MIKRFSLNNREYVYFETMWGSLWGLNFDIYVGQRAGGSWVASLQTRLLKWDLFVALYVGGN